MSITILGDDSELLSLSALRNTEQVVTRTILNTVVVTDIYASVSIDDPVVDVVVTVDDDSVVTTVVMDEESVYANIDADDVITANQVDEEDIVIHAVVEVIE